MIAQKSLFQHSFPFSLNRLLPPAYAAIFVILIQIPIRLSAQSITLDSCFVQAQRHYPLIRQYALLEQSKQFSLENVSRGFLPMLSVNGQLTHQSDVTGLPFSMPGATVEPLSKTQYRLYGEIIQPLTDLYTVSRQKELTRSNIESETKKLDTELYKLRERIQQLYFGILLLDAQINQTELLKKDLRAGLERTQSAVKNGVALKSASDVLQAELLRAEQRTTELSAGRKSYLLMLSAFLNRELSGQTALQIPADPEIQKNIQRAELGLFDAQKRSAAIQEQLVSARILPKLNLFLQSGVGRPALNMLDNDPAFYYTGGIRLNWNLSGFYTSGKEKKIIGLQSKTIDVQKDIFLFNTNLNLSQQEQEIAKLHALMATDNDIILLREQVKVSAHSQLENGTMTANEYLTTVNAEDQARQNLALHKIQLLMAKYTYKLTTGF